MEDKTLTLSVCSGSYAGIYDGDHGDGGQAVQQPLHHRGGPEKAFGGGQGRKHRGGDSQDCHGGLQELGLICRVCTVFKYK